jgi:hypothetical protein
MKGKVDENKTFLSPNNVIPLCCYLLISNVVTPLLLRFFFQVIGGRMSLYNLSRLPLIIPLSSVPPKSFNYTTPPSVTFFTLYGPNECILSFPGVEEIYCHTPRLGLPP